MSRLRCTPGLVKTALAAALLVTVAAACDEDGKSLPATCDDPLPLDDIANAGVPAVSNPCVTPIGHAVSFVGNTTSTTGGADAGAGAGGT